MRFLYPEILLLLLFLPGLIFLRGKTGPAPAMIFSTTTIVSKLAKAKKARAGQLLMGFKLLAIACILFAIARPQLVKITTEIEIPGIDILLAVDISGSMKAMDFTVEGKASNRLEAVKKVLGEFIDKRPNDRIGLIAFGGQPYLVSPLTMDHDWLKNRLASLQIGMVGEKTTAIGSAIGAGVNRLRDRESKSRVIILLTDGMNNAGKVQPLIAAEGAETLGIKIYTIGAGTHGKAPIPVVDRLGRKSMMKVDVDIDEETLDRVAEVTNAKYFRATDTDTLQKIYNDIDIMETTAQKFKKYEKSKDIFYIPLFFVILFISLSMLLAIKRLP